MAYIGDRYAPFCRPKKGRLGAEKGCFGGCFYCTIRSIEPISPIRPISYDCTLILPEFAGKSFLFSNTRFFGVQKRAIFNFCKFVFKPNRRDGAVSARANRGCASDSLPPNTPQRHLRFRNIISNFAQKTTTHTNQIKKHNESKGTLHNGSGGCGICRGGARRHLHCEPRDWLAGLDNHRGRHHRDGLDAAHRRLAVPLDDRKIRLGAGLPHRQRAAP